MLSLKLYSLVTMVLGKQLPFQCPYKVPADSTGPSTRGENGGGLPSTLYEDGLLDQNDSDTYEEYKAALALVPCDARAISVFTNRLVAGKYAISVIYVYDKSVEDLKIWLREKLYAATFEETNPIADAVTTQCPNLAKQLHNPYERRLGGDEILKILCEGQCEQQKTYDTFFVLESGNICSDFNRRIVNDVRSCRSAVPKLKYFDPRSNFERVETRSDWPSGCYITNGGIYFNNHSTGNRNPMAHHICRTGLDLPFFDGWCRYGSDNREWTNGYAIKNDILCYQKCHNTTGCSAFSFEYNDVEEPCNIYAGGPYTYGNGRVNTKCHTIPKGSPLSSPRTFPNGNKTTNMRETLSDEFLLESTTSSDPSSSDNSSAKNTLRNQNGQTNRFDESKLLGNISVGSEYTDQDLRSLVNQTKLVYSQSNHEHFGSEKSIRGPISHENLSSLRASSHCASGTHSQIQECCGTTNPCAEGQGDCDKDSECLGNLICGKNNCDPSKFPSNKTDCCTSIVAVLNQDPSEFAFQSGMYCPKRSRIKMYRTLSKAFDACSNDNNCVSITDLRCDDEKFYTCQNDSKSSTKGSCSWVRKELDDDDVNYVETSSNQSRPKRDIRHANDQIQYYEADLLNSYPHNYPSISYKPPTTIQNSGYFRKQKSAISSQKGVHIPALFDVWRYPVPLHQLLWQKLRDMSSLEVLPHQLDYKLGIGSTHNYLSPPRNSEINKLFYYLPPINYAPSYHPPKVTFDDAPKIVYGISFRVRRKYECGEKDFDCDQMIAEGNVVDCNIPRFSPCPDEWMECVSEDETFVETTTFYDDCNIASLGNPTEKDLFESVTANKCSENRRCEYRRLPSGDSPFVGYDPSGNCTCPLSKPPKVLYTYHNRFKRQAGESYTTGGKPLCRVQRPRKGRGRVMCDMLVNVRSKRYAKSTKIAVLEDSTFNLAQDPAICALFSDNCI